jgi:hypothetical protein
LFTEQAKAALRLFPANSLRAALNALADYGVARDV